MIAAIEAGLFRREISDAAFAYQRELDAGRKLIVGVNAFEEAEEKPIDLLEIDESVERHQQAGAVTDDRNGEQRKEEQHR